MATFLPSLNAGYWSGSESSASDFDDAPPPVKKNRPGQMARRAIAEKKHGSGANHIKKGLPPVAEMGKKKGDGWDAKRGATDGGRGRGGGFGARGRGGSDRGGRQREFSQVTGENAIAVSLGPGRRRETMSACCTPVGKLRRRRRRRSKLLHSKAKRSHLIKLASIPMIMMKNNSKRK